MGKTWVQKRDINKEYQVKINPKKFADIPAGTKMFIPTPQILDNFVQDIPPSSFLTLKQIRQDLSRKYNAEMTCPLVTGISLRIISEAAFEEYQIDQNMEETLKAARILSKDNFEIYV